MYLGASHAAHPWIVDPAPAVLDLTSCGGNGDETGPQAQVATVTVAPGELTLPVGQSQQLTATADDQDGNPLDGRPFTWATSEPTTATVSEAGVVTGIGPGSAVSPEPASNPRQVAVS